MRPYYALNVMVCKIIFILTLTTFLLSQDTAPIYQFLHKKHNEHYYTKNPKPKGKWEAQGIEFYAFPIDLLKKKRIFQSFE